MAKLFCRCRIAVAAALAELPCEVVQIVFDPPFHHLPGVRIGRHILYRMHDADTIVLPQAPRGQAPDPSSAGTLRVPLLQTRMDSCSSEAGEGASVSRRKSSIQQLQASGTWATMTKAEQAARLELERRRAMTPVGLNQSEVNYFEKLCDWFEKEGCQLLPSDGGVLADMVRYIQVGDYENADAIRDSILSRAPAPAVVQEPVVQPQKASFVA